METHKTFQENLVTYLMGELPAEDARALEQHLRSCSDCAARLKAYRATLEAAEAVPDIEPSPGYVQRTLEAARSAQAAHEQFLQNEAAQRFAAAEERLEAPAPAPRQSLTYRIARLVAFASAVVIVFLATSSIIDNEMPPAEREQTHEPAGPEEEIADAKEPRAFPVVPLERIPGEVWDLKDIPMIQTPPLELKPEKELAYAVPPFPGIPELHVLRANIPNPAYRSRVDWPEKKKAMWQAAGGHTTSAIERRQAIVRGLWWLARHQDTDGKWDAANFSAHCPRSQKCAGSHAPVLSNEGVTAAALLAMLGDGHTPSRGKFKAHVARGVQWLQSRQQPDGSIGEIRYAGEHSLLCHAIAAAALAETYGMTGEARYQVAAQRAANYLLRHDVDVADAQSRLIVKNIGVAAVRMAALGAAEIARLDIPRDSAEATAMIFAKAARSSSTAYAYPSDGTTRVMITAGMLALLDPAAKLDESLLAGERPRLRENLPDWDKNGQAYWLCGSIITKKDGGPIWWRWNRVLQKTMIRHQRKSGHAIGSWAANDPSSRLGGPVFSTALSILALETPYR